ncbi:multiheme c-type cytochrome [Ferrimonas balearica]|uniref:multiheme c-type cytochrome n=1 Tax=Ferrimonas balearica TaxID=44012 RepID=UPI001F32CF97|nr:cytochrome c3 family protein [Ferrimonas balearica]MBY6093402.1 hypothetical protein [Ferrimonas balearica]
MSDHNNNWKKLASALAVSALLAGCGSDGKDGSDGEDGKPGPVGVHINTATALTATNIHSELDADANRLTIEFDLTDARGVAVHSAEISNFALKLGRMGTVGELPEASWPGNPEEPNADKLAREIWLSYHHRSNDRGTASLCSDSYTPYNECAIESNNGRYTITIDHALPVDADEGTSQFFFDYDASQVHGLMMRARGEQATTYAHHYWDNAADMAADRPKPVVGQEACDACHTDTNDLGRFASNKHYGTQLETCTFCHVDYAEKGTRTDANGTEYTVDHSTKGLVHNIHHMATNSRNFALVKSDLTRILHPSVGTDGEGDDATNIYGKFPSRTSDCTVCHTDPADAEPAELALAEHLWHTDNDGKTCLNCHGQAHATSYNDCTQCHSNDGSGRGALDAHFDRNNSRGALDFAPIFSDVAYDGATLSAKVQLTDGERDALPEHLSSVRVYFNATAGEDFLIGSTSKSVTLTADIHNGTAYQLAITDADLNAALATNASASFTVVGALCFGNKNQDLIACAEDNSHTGRLMGEMQYFDVTGQGEVAFRHNPAANENCTACHNESFRGSHYSGDIDTCATCHNSEREKNGYDTRYFAYTIHDKHYLFNNGGNVFFKKSDCAVCHDDGYQLNNVADRLVKWKNSDGELAYSTPQAAACMSCHDKFDNGSASAHIESMGGFHKAQLDNIVPGQETCATCHNAENIQKNHKFD